MKISELLADIDRLESEVQIKNEENINLCREFELLETIQAETEASVKELI